MDADLLARGEAVFAPLPQYSTLSATGADARAFLHAQLSSDIEHLGAGSARRAGYCSPKGRLLASFLVVPQGDGFLLQVSRDIAPAIAKRLSMYVLRSKVKLTDADALWSQFGIWGRDSAALLAAAGIAVPAGAMQVADSPQQTTVCTVRLGPERFLVFAPQALAAALAGALPQVAPEWWNLGEIRAGVPLIGQATQELFVPQMANFELVGGVDFKKGCYPGQEIVARSQYLGSLKRRMYRAATDAAGAAAPQPGQDVFDAQAQAVGTVVNVAPRPEGGSEVLAVLQAAGAQGGGELRLGAADGPLARILELPYPL